MKNTSDYLMLGLLLICMRWDKKVCYKVLDNNRMLIEAGRNEGRNEERANTERERLRAQKETKRADDEAKGANEAEQTVADLKRIMHEYGIVV